MTKNIEEMLTEYGAQWRFEQTAHQRPSLQDSAIRRVYRRTVSLVAAAAVPLIVAASVVAIGHHPHKGQSPAAGSLTVPWKSTSQSNLSKQHLVVPASASGLPAADPATPACDNRSFDVLTAARNDSNNVSIVATYLGTSACRISGEGPSVALFDRSGIGVLTGGYTRLDLRKPLVVRPGQVVRTGVVWYSACSVPSDVATMAFDFQASSTGDLTVPIASTMRAPACESTTGRSQLATFPTSVFNAGSLEALTVEVSAPSTATAGSTLSYSVELENLTKRGVSLQPCPVFEEGLLDESRGVIATPTRDEVNCEQAPTEISAGESIKLDMELAIPLSGPLPAAKLAWRLFSGDPSDFEISTYPTVRIIP